MNDANADPLLAELRGLTGAPSMTSPDARPPEPKAPDPLEVQPKAQQGTAVSRADAKFSIAAGGKGYRVVVAGDYFAPPKEGKGKILKKYELAFNLPSLDAALSVIVSKLLLPALKKYHPEVINYHTYNLVSAVPLTPDTPPTNSLQFMDRDRLERYIQDNGVPISPKEYDDVVVLREAVIDHRLNPKGFEDREARKQKERAETAALMAMNPDLREPSGKEEPVNA